MSNFEKDEQLLKRLIIGDEELLKELFKEFLAPFTKFILVGKQVSYDEAEEIYIKAFTIFWSNIKNGKLVPPLHSTLKTYLFGIGDNLLKKHFEKKGRNREQSSDDLENEAKGMSSAPGIFDFYEMENRKKFIQKLLDQLDESCRELLILTFFKEYSDDALCAMLGLKNEGAVRQRRFRCLEKLRNLL